MKKEKETSVIATFNSLLISDFIKNNGSPTRDIDLYEILPPIPLQRSRVVLAIKQDIVETTEALLVSAQDNLVLPRVFDPDSIIREAI